MPHTTRKNAREWQRLWRGGEIITEIDGDDPRMPPGADVSAAGGPSLSDLRNIKDVMLRLSGDDTATTSRGRNRRRCRMLMGRSRLSHLATCAVVIVDR